MEREITVPIKADVHHGFSSSSSSSVCAPPIWKMGSEQEMDRRASILFINGPKALDSARDNFKITPKSLDNFEKRPSICQAEKCYFKYFSFCPN